MGAVPGPWASDRGAWGYGPQHRHHGGTGSCSRARNNSTRIIILATTISGHVGHARPWAGRLLPGSVPSRPSAPGCLSEWPRGRFSAHFSACLSLAPSCFTEDKPRHGEWSETGPGPRASTRQRSLLRGGHGSAPVPGAGVTRSPGPVLRHGSPATGVQRPPSASGCPEDPPWTL